MDDIFLGGDTMTGMNESVREAVKQAMKGRKLTQRELARAVDMEPPNISRLLSGASGRVPETWQKILDELGLELIAVPKRGN